ncbi:sulfate transport protein cysz [Canicola haemoglobinophilus]|uniref:Sulfate transport protein cysz n=1 Tax=Canicola haemoglobinophilus TaxID=733 RepID=A0A377HTJ6_9PAST|nr:sulfate transport protein cysz [Canicola haemoglobinophilus]
MQFDERIQAAKTLIDECLAEWSKDSRPELKTIIDRAFNVDKEGNLNTGRILELRRVEIQYPRWLNAMQAIIESIQVVSSKSYVRFYERVGDSDQYQPISLDIAGVAN